MNGFDDLKAAGWRIVVRGVLGAETWGHIEHPSYGRAEVSSNRSQFAGMSNIEAFEYACVETCLAFVSGRGGRGFVPLDEDGRMLFREACERVPK